MHTPHQIYLLSTHHDAQYKLMECLLFHLDS
jgi:hypothetical protein